MERTEVQLNLGARSYPIAVTSGELAEVGRFARSRSPAQQSLVVCDEQTERLFADVVSRSLSDAGFRVRRSVLPPGETTKSLTHATTLYGDLVEMAADRQTLVVALGGGVVGDLAGFVAATYARGIAFLQIPTSLMAQVDSSVGGKVAVNFQAPGGRWIKNIVGAFHQPVGVYVDTETLNSLPREELQAGLAEVVKYGVILDSNFFAFLESHADDLLRLAPAVTRHVVAHCCRLKADVVEADEREVTDRRAILNYGHTFAHAIEAISRNYRHGEAVAIGMVAASRLAERLGRVPGDVTDRQVRLLERFGLPVMAPGLDPAELLRAMRHDKKASADQLRFVLPRKIGEVELASDVPVTVVQDVLAQMTTNNEEKP